MNKLYNCALSSEPGNMNGAGFLQKIVTKTGPAPGLWKFRQTALNRITVHVPQLLNTFVMSKDIEVVIAFLPEGAGSQASGDREFKSLQDLGKWNLRIERLAHQKMNMLRHDDITENLKVIAATSEFQ
jgi:hypothetical protein